jgi:hypothetical protein
VFTTRVASPYAGKTFHIEVDGVNVSGPITVPQTGSWQTWTDVASAPIALSAGDYTLRLVMDTNGYNLNYLTVSGPQP